MNTEIQHNSFDGRDTELGSKNWIFGEATSRIDGSQDEKPLITIARPSQMLNKDAPDIHSQSLTSTNAVVGRFGSACTTTEVGVHGIQSFANMEHIYFGGPSGNSGSHSSDSISGAQKPSSRSSASYDARRRMLSLVFTCDFCPIVFETHEDMCEHTKKVHFGCTLESSDRIFLICICGKVNFGKKQLDWHSAKHHGLEKCDVCPDKSEIKTTAYHHHIDHFQMYRYQCSRCLDRFKTREEFDSKKKHKCDCIRIPAWRLPCSYGNYWKFCKTGITCERF